MKTETIIQGVGTCNGNPINEQLEVTREDNDPADLETGRWGGGVVFEQGYKE